MTREEFIKRAEALHQDAQDSELWQEEAMMAAVCGAFHANSIPAMLAALKPYADSEMARLSLLKNSPS